MRREKRPFKEHKIRKCGVTKCDAVTWSGDYHWPRCRLYARVPGSMDKNVPKSHDFFSSLLHHRWKRKKKRAKRSCHSRTGRRTMFQVGAGQWSGTLWCCALSVSGRITRRQAKNEWKSSHFTFCVSWLCEQNARRVSIVCRSADSLKFARKSTVHWNWMKFALKRELNVLITKVITSFPNSMLKRLKSAVYWVTLRVICIPWG